MFSSLQVAVLQDFADAPQKIFAKAEPLPARVDPIWHVDANDPRARRFVPASGEIKT